MTSFFLASPHGERYLHDINRDAFLRTPSAEVFERWFDTDFGAQDTFFLIVGTDSGLLPRWLQHVPLGAGSQFLFVELDQYHELIDDSLVGENDTAIDLCRSSEWETRLAEIDPSRWLYAGSLLVVESVGCGAGYAADYRRLLRQIRTRMSELVHAARTQIDQRAFIGVQLRNAADNLVPARSQGRIGEGRTAIVLGGGPSLDEHIDWIVDNRERLFVIAACRLAGKLAAIGLEPDVIIAVDPQDMLFDISKESLELESTTLVSAFHVCAPLLQQWRGPTLYTGRALPWENEAIDDADNIAAVGPTVSHSALWLAYEWGFSQILLTGVDLCFAPGGATHATGSVESLCTSLPCHYERQVDTYSGRRAGTSTILKAGCDALESIGAVVAAADVRLYNLAPDAARILSIEHIGMHDLDLENARPRLDITRSDPTKSLAHLRKVLREFDAAGKGFHAIGLECAEAQLCLDGLHGSSGKQADYRFKRKLDAIERRLQRRHARWLKAVVAYGASQLIRGVNPRSFDEMSDEELEAWGRDYYQSIGLNAKRLGELVTGARKRAKNRMLEASPAGSVELLIDYWRRDATLGRVLTVFANPSSELSVDENDAIERARSEHAERLGSAENVFERRHTATKANAASVLRTIALLFTEADREDLALLIQGLDAMGMQWQPIALWASGQHAELGNDSQLAQEYYREILELHADMNESGTSLLPGADRLLEDTLLRIVQLQLAGGDGEAAMQGLSILAGMSPAYLPRLAALLGLLGRHFDAIELLEEAIGSGRGDWRIALQMADLYQAAGADEASAVATELAQRMRNTPLTTDTPDAHRAAA